MQELGYLALPITTAESYDAGSISRVRAKKKQMGKAIAVMKYHIRSRLYSFKHMRL